jgi:cyclophilin family peptidyl-prolyl cis-trans isomerase
MAQPNVVLETSLGTIHIALEPEKAPKTVENFLKYVDDGHYAGTVFHRVIENFMVQGGGYDEKYAKKPVREPVENEAHNGLKNVRGSVAMARTNEPHSATAQFFINVVDNAFLDHKEKNGADWGYAVFGKVTGGMDVVDKIKALPTAARGAFQKDVPVETVLIKSAKRV